jgi:two-component system, OmpR family, KDP operon response regulator KdpE
VNILVVEDDLQLRRTLTIYLGAQGFVVDAVSTGEDALQIAGRKLPDLVLLDLGLPGIDGMAVIVELRRWSDVPIIVLSARGAEDDKVSALDAGANDYLTKPFGVNEMMARIRATLRVVGEKPATVITTAAFVVDLQRLEVRRGEVTVHLTPIEWGLLTHLVRADGQLVSQPTLLRAVWGPEYVSETNYLRVHMTHLRQKLEPEPSRPRYFFTEPGLGYRFLRDLS